MTQELSTAERERARALAAQEQDAAQEHRDRERYENDAVRTAAAVAAAMRSFDVRGENSILATAYHNEVALSILETPTGVTFMFHRKFGHYSQHGVRMVDLERFSSTGPTYYRVTGETFMLKPSPKPTYQPPPGVLTGETVHMVLPHEKPLAPSHRTAAALVRALIVATGAAPTMVARARRRPAPRVNYCQRARLTATMAALSAYPVATQVAAPARYPLALTAAQQ